MTLTDRSAVLSGGDGSIVVVVDEQAARLPMQGQSSTAREGAMAVSVSQETLDGMRAGFSGQVLARGDAATRRLAGSTTG
jgi:hypothetical protein